MPVMIALGVAGLASSMAGGIMGAQGKASSMKAQAMQAEINRKWDEFGKELDLGRQRGQMGLAEFDRLFANQTIERDSLASQLAQGRAAQEQYEYASAQFSRSYRQMRAATEASMASRGAARGGTAEAIAKQMEMDASSDQLRIKANFNNQMDMFETQRNQQLSKRNLRQTTAPPQYIPSTPVPMPNTSGMVAGATLSGLGGMLGGLAGMKDGSGNSIWGE